MRVFRSAHIIALAMLVSAGKPIKKEPPIVALPPAILADDDTDTVKAEVKKILKDPYSSVFSDFRAGLNDSGSIMVCGTVNAKNSFGAYTGSRTFFGILSQKDGKKYFFLVNDMDDRGSRAAKMVCTQNGL